LTLADDHHPPPNDFDNFNFLVIYLFLDIPIVMKKLKYISRMGYREEREEDYGRDKKWHNSRAHGLEHKMTGTVAFMAVPCCSSL
jgi:hypothetical protein